MVRLGALAAGMEWRDHLTVGGKRLRRQFSNLKHARWQRASVIHGLPPIGTMVKPVAGPILPRSNRLPQQALRFSYSPGRTPRAPR
jgi:hypothetical protein